MSGGIPFRALGFALALLLAGAAGNVRAGALAPGLREVLSSAGPATFIPAVLLIVHISGMWLDVDALAAPDSHYYRVSAEHSGGA